MEKIKKAKRVQKCVAWSIIYFVLGIVAISTIFPYLWMVLASLKSGIEITTYPEKIFPSAPNLSAYVSAFQKLNLITGIKNTLLLEVFSVTFPPFVSALGAFAFAKLALPGKRVLLLTLLSSMMIGGLIVLTFRLGI